MRLRLLIVVFLVLTCRAMSADKGIAHVPLPADLTGTLNRTDYIIRVPANWNGTLLVFAHEAQLGPPVAQAAPIAWPLVTPSLEQQLLELGYALAGSGYRSDSIKEAVQRTLALTNFFKGRIGNPSRTIIWGTSLGGMVSLKLIEDHPDIYAGAIANAAPAAGNPENADEDLSFCLAYAAAFPWHEDLWGPVEDLRDDLDYFAEVLPILLAEALPGPDTFGRWEFIRLVMKIPPEAFWGLDPVNGSPFWAMLMWRATETRAAMEAQDGGPVAENVDLQYALIPTEKDYLASFGVDADEMLAYMNARTNITADRAARILAGHWGGFSGRLLRPVLTMHSRFDGLISVSQESYYAALVQTAGYSDQLVQAYVNDVGHISFSADQYLSVLAALESWLDTGVRPGESLLPASKGFDLTYIPPPWPF
jgi:pimeloyl-ACP methyl ester carboxylesterase